MGHICSWGCGYSAAQIPFIIVDLRANIRVSKNIGLHFRKKKYILKKIPIFLLKIHKKWAIFIPQKGAIGKCIVGRQN